MMPRTITHRDNFAFTAIANDQLLQSKNQNSICTEGYLTLKNGQKLSESRTKFRLRVGKKYETLPQEKELQLIIA